MKVVLIKDLEIEGKRYLEGEEVNLTKSDFERYNKLIISDRIEKYSSTDTKAEERK